MRNPIELRVVGGASPQKPRRRRQKSADEHGGFSIRADGWLEAINSEGKSKPVCSRLRVPALTRDSDGRNWGRLIEATDSDNRVHRLTIGADLLVDRGEQVIRILANHGLLLEPGTFARNALLRFLSSAVDIEGRDLPRALAALRTGWHGQAFVLPGGAIGGTELVAYQPTSNLVAAIRKASTLEAWQEEIAARAVGNSRLILSLSTAFAAPLLGPLSYPEGFGVHLRGASSAGKTTALEVAGSVWGGGGLAGFRQPWHATANGIEAMAEAHCDLPLCLDELGQVRPEDAGRVAYQLSAGTGKQRALNDGSAASRREWRLVFLSTGEISLADKLREAKTPLREMAGQAVRFIDIAADAGKGYGIFDNVPSLETRCDATPKERGRAFADQLISAARTYYGTAGPAFVERFIADRESAVEQVRRVMDELASHLAPTDADGQVQRVARHLSLLAAAGELAAVLRVVPWPAGAAIDAIKACFSSWLSARGTAGSFEVNDTHAYLRSVIERDGGSRFQRFGDQHEPVRDRLGYTRGESTGDVEYLILPEMWKLLMVGRDPKRTAHDLASAGVIRRDSDGRSTRKERLPGLQNPQRVYVISHTALFAEAEGDADG